MITTTAPSHLRDEGRAFFVEMSASHQLDAGSIAVLTRAAECLDRIAAARAAILKDGEFPETQYGTPKMHPALILEKGPRNAFFAAMRLLNIDVSAGPGRDAAPWE